MDLQMASLNKQSEKIKVEIVDSEVITTEASSSDINNLLLSNKDNQIRKKKKHKKGKKRCHDSLNLNADEYERRESERLQRTREHMIRQGKTLAPSNTTQFIMAEHSEENKAHFDSINSSDTDSDTTNEENYLCHEFNEEYEMLQHDHYRHLNKEELLNECFDILDELNKLQSTVTRLTHENTKLKQKLNDYESAKLEESKMIN